MPNRPPKLTHRLRDLLLEIRQGDDQLLVTAIVLKYGDDADLNALKRLGLVKIVDQAIVQNRETKLQAAAVAMTQLGHATLGELTS